jgi:hypothetical protein
MGMAISSHSITRAVPRKFIVALQLDGDLSARCKQGFLVKFTNKVVILTNKKGS